MKARLDVVNVTDNVYQLRTGNGRRRQRRPIRRAARLVRDVELFVLSTGAEFMTALNANGARGRLRVEIRDGAGLPARPHAHAQRKLAWANSICLLFLVVGLAGFRPGPHRQSWSNPWRKPRQLSSSRPRPPSPATEPKTRGEQETRNNPKPRKVVIVTPDTPAITFQRAHPRQRRWSRSPSRRPRRPPLCGRRRSPGAQQQPSLLSNTGSGGDRPQPQYPLMAEQLGQQGSVVLLLTVDDAGVVASVEVKQTSGFSILDRYSVEFVKRHWTVEPGAPGRLFQATINFQLVTRLESP